MKRDTEFLYEIGAMRHIPRQWSRFLGIPFANLTEHHYRVIWIALAIAAQEGATNTDKIMKMALVHDIPESRTGDVDYLARQYVDRHEDKGIADMLKDTSLEAEFVTLWQEYEKRDCIEAKIVKDADNLDIDLELAEQAAMGVTLGERFKPMREHVAATKLFTATAKKMYKTIEATDPHDWHLKADSNRINGGDWKK